MCSFNFWMQSFNMHINVLATTSVCRHKVCIHVHSDSFIAITVHPCSSSWYSAGQILQVHMQAEKTCMNCTVLWKFHHQSTSLDLRSSVYDVMSGGVDLQGNVSVRHSILMSSKFTLSCLQLGSCNLSWGIHSPHLKLHAWQSSRYTTQLMNKNALLCMHV